jgi:hypothetical protein
MPAPARTVLAGTVLAAASLVATAPPAAANLANVGVDSCAMDSYGGQWVECTVVMRGAWYRVTAIGRDEGWARADVWCNASGVGASAITNGYNTSRHTDVYLPTGTCTLSVYADWHGTGAVSLRP